MCVCVTYDKTGRVEPILTHLSVGLGIWLSSASVEFRFLGSGLGSEKDVDDGDGRC